MSCLSRLKEILIGWFFTHWHFDQSIKRQDMDCPLRHRFARSHFNDAPIFYICSQEYIHSLHHDPSVTPVFYHYLYHHVSGHQPRIRRKMISTVWRQRRHYKKSVYQKKNIFWRKDKKGWDFIQCLNIVLSFRSTLHSPTSLMAAVRRSVRETPRVRPR